MKNRANKNVMLKSIRESYNNCYLGKFRSPNICRLNIFCDNRFPMQGEEGMYYQGVYKYREPMR